MSSLRKKPKDTWSDPERSAYRIYKYKSALNSVFDAPHTAKFIPRPTIRGHHVTLYAIVDPTVLADRWQIYGIPLNPTDRQIIQLPKNAQILGVALMKPEILPSTDADTDDDDSDDDADSDDADGIDVDTDIVPPGVAGDPSSDKTEAKITLIYAVCIPADTSINRTIYIHGTGHNIYSTQIQYVGAFAIKNKHIHHVFVK